MIVFLTSSPSGSYDGFEREESFNGLNPANHFIENLAEAWPDHPARGLVIAADPEDAEGNNAMAEYFWGIFEDAGLSCECFDVWDYRVEDDSREMLFSYDIILLGGGHVPTQNAFFHALELPEKLKGYEGIVMGISAGSMDAADVVYAQPELEGEGIDPDYERWLPGLGLTYTMILPHYQAVKDHILDGLRLFEDITYADSFDNRFLALPDGSYLLIADGEETVWGEAWQIADGELTKICESGEVIQWDDHTLV